MRLFDRDLVFIEPKRLGHEGRLAGGTQSAGSQIPRHSSKPELADRYQLRPHWPGMAVLVYCAGIVCAPGGWLGDRTLLDRQVDIEKLQMALSQRKPSPALLHHSDRGSQYASGRYRTLLAEQHVVPSMSRSATSMTMR